MVRETRQHTGSARTKHGSRARDSTVKHRAPPCTTPRPAATTWRPRRTLCSAARAPSAPARCRAPTTPDAPPTVPTNALGLPLLPHRVEERRLLGPLIFHLLPLRAAAAAVVARPAGRRGAVGRLLLPLDALAERRDRLAGGAEVVVDTPVGGEGDNTTWRDRRAPGARATSMRNKSERRKKARVSTSAWKDTVG